MCVYVDIYVYIYIYLHTNVCGKHISFTRHDTRLGRGSHQRKLYDIQLFFKGNVNSSTSQTQRVRSWWTVPIEKVLHHCLNRIEYLVSTRPRVYIDSLWIFCCLTPRLPKQLVFCGPFFLVAGRMRFTSLVPKAFPKSKSSRFLRRE